MTLLIFILFSFLSFSQHAVQFIISSSPSGNFADSNLFMAGSFNGWNPYDSHYQFEKNQNGIYILTITLNAGRYEFKITRGGWNKVECKKDGADIQNRVVHIKSDTTIDLIVEDWLDKFSKKPRISTASKNVQILDKAFLMPQLGRTRRIWIYLPAGYSTSKESYPVLYLQDGQNVFDDSTSFAGEWRVDETLDSLSSHRKKMIVVAVDNGGNKRINEYSPYDMDRYGRGEGDLYVDFIVKTLKPFIDATCRTLKDKKNTLIAGSSMGGLISMYAVLKYPEIFGGAAIFSPAFWIAPKIFDEINKKGNQVNSKIYFYCGTQEGEMMEPDMLKVFEEMRQISRSPMISCIRPGGKHNEAVWEEEFPLFYLWISQK